MDDLQLAVEDAAAATPAVIDGADVEVLETQDQPAATAEIAEAEEIDFETALLADDSKDSIDSKDSKDSAAEQSKEEETDGGQGKLSEYLTTIKNLNATLDKLVESPDESATTKTLRRLNKELLHKHEGQVGEFIKLANFGSPERIEEALNLLDGLHGYDTANGNPSTHKTANLLTVKEPETAYNLALNILSHSTQDGTSFAELFTKQVLGIDPKRLADFRAISNGEIPEGYEGMISKSEDLAAIPEQFQDAFKRLTPKMKEIVMEGSDTYATASEKAEAQRVLLDSQNVINTARTKESDEAARTTRLEGALQTKATEIESQSTESIGTRIDNTLTKVAFSSDEAVDLTMKQAVSNQIFNLVHESPYIRAKSEQYFKAVGVDIAALRPKVDYWFNRLSENIDIETVATVRGQKTAQEQAHRVRMEAESHLAALGTRLIIDVAKKTGAGLKAKGAVSVPTGQLPVTQGKSSSDGTTNGSPDYKAYAAATRESRVLKAA